MSKETGLGWTTADVDNAGGTPCHLKNDFQSLQFSTPRAVIDWTGLDKSAFERGLALADFSITYNGTFNDATDMGHSVFSTISSNSATRTNTLVISAQTLTTEVIFTDYPLSRGADGALTYAVPGVLADGTVPTWT
jgi:hypothetical protein